MVFSSLTFLFYFLPAVLAVYFIVPRRFKNVVLLVFSLAFYGWGEPVYITLMIVSILMDYGLGIWMHRCLTRGDQKGAKRVLILAVVLNLALLAFFKYANFLIDNLNQVPGIRIPALDLPLPIGISFYTFQAMSYLIDLYRGDVPVQKSVIAFGTYVSLFPQLIAGPIVRMSTVSEELSHRRESADLFSSGIRRFMTGLGKKVLLANNIGMVWSAISAQDASTLPVLTAWTGLAAFTFQIYFDFSGYSDMAIGLGRMFGFHFLENFNYPYMAVSITDFWRRWHISLSTWFREYVYIPLGGNRRGKGRQLFNLLVVWMLTGIWHGASWNFVAWGLYFGIWLALEKFVLRRYLDKAPRWVGHVYTLLLVMVSWCIFAFDSLSSGLGYLRALVGGYGQGLWDSAGLYTLYTNALLFLLLILFSTPLPMKLYRRAEKALRPRPALAGTVEIVPLLLLGAVCVAFLVDASYNPFLYFRF
ncbi:MAG: MBOAT family protein [Clostridiales bacterium]|jgi:alginate O-acetyltransferase complex protein AlgI|nr:MBOAT family protein [Clostridiales bacterium]